MPDTTRSLVHRFLNEERGITDETLEAWGITDDGEWITYVYPNGSKQRSLDSDGTRHFRSAKGAVTGLYSRPSEGQHSSLAFVCEGESDALRLWQELGGAIDVYGIPGVNTWRDTFADELRGYETVYVVLDNDDDYKVAAIVDRTWLAIRKSVGAASKRINLPDGVNDLCEFFDEYPIDTLRQLAERAETQGSWHYKALDLNKAPTKPNWLVDDLIAQGDLCMMIGEPGIGKSWISMALAVAVAEGLKTFLGRSLNTPNERVLYVDEENPEPLIPFRLKRLGLNGGIKNIRYLHQQGVRIDRHPDHILEEALDYSPALIVLDSLTRLHTKDENNAGEISALFNDGIVPLARTTGATVVLLHHVNKSDSASSFTRARGSSDLSGVIDTGLDLRGSSGSLTLHHYKSRWIADNTGIQLKIEDTDEGGVALVTRVESALF